MKYLILGRSGSGKDYYANLLKQAGLQFVDSYTTRPKRSEDEDTHRFITEEEASTYTDKIAVTIINGYEYFATATQVEESDAYIIDPKGADILFKNMPETEFQIIYITTDNIDKRKEMAINRSTDSIKESVIYDKRIQDEDEQFTKFENKLANIKNQNDIKKEFPIGNISKVIIINNDYNANSAKDTIKFLVKNLKN